MLLRLEGVHLHGEFRRRDHGRQEKELPSHQLGPVTEIEIFRERVMLPSTFRINGFASPHAGGAVEIEETASPIPCPMLEHEVSVEHDRLNLREQRIILVDMA